MNVIWKSLDKIDIVYSKDAITFGNVHYPKAYIVEHGNKKSLDAAINWSRSCNPTIITAENSDFDMQIAEAPGNSSQSGKLAFWMCIFSKDDIPAFATGINSELLSILILQSALLNGKLKENKVFFARSSGQLGVLHKNMAEYKNFCNDIKTRENVNNGSKTKKWQPGYTYITTKETDVMLGYVKSPLYCNGYLNDWTLDFNVGPKVFYGFYDKNMTFDEIVHYALNNIPRKSCPSRIVGGKIFNVDDTFESKIYDAIERDYFNSLNDNSMYMNTYVSALERILTIYDYNPEKALVLLEDIENRIMGNLSKRETRRNYNDDHYLTYNGMKNVLYNDGESLALDIIKYTRVHHNLKGAN